MVNFGPLAVEIGSVVCGIPANYNGFCVLAALVHGIPVVSVSQTCVCVCVCVWTDDVSAVMSWRQAPASTCSFVCSRLSRTRAAAITCCCTLCCWGTASCRSCCCRALMTLLRPRMTLRPPRHRRRRSRKPCSLPSSTSSRGVRCSPRHCVKLLFRSPSAPMTGWFRMLRRTPTSPRRIHCGWELSSGDLIHSLPESSSGESIVWCLRRSDQQ